MSNRSIEGVTETVPLGRLVERVVAGRIRVPKFQRNFVWKQDDLHQLLDSILQGFPIGSILIWETEERVETTTRFGPIEIGPRPNGTISYLLDGQQRMSTLVGTLRLPEEADTIVDDVDWRVYCNLESLGFERAATTKPEPQYFPVRNLLDTSRFFAACQRIEEQTEDKEQSRRWIDEADRLANAFRDYQLPVVNIHEADLDSAVTVFARLSSTGRRMAADELATALTYRKGRFHLAGELDTLKEELAIEGFADLDRTLVLRSVLAALDKNIYARDWATLVSRPDVRERLPEAFDTATRGLMRAIGFLKELGVTFGSTTALRPTARSHRRVLSSVPAADGQQDRDAEAMVLDHIVHQLVRHGQHHAEDTCARRDPQSRARHAGQARHRRPRYTRPTIPRTLRQPKRTRACLHALSLIASATLPSQRRISGPWAAALHSWGPGVGIHIIQPEPDRRSLQQSCEPDVRRHGQD